MITCREFVEFIGAYLERDISPEAMAEFNGHMARCPWCVIYLKTYEETVLIGLQAFSDLEADVPEDMPEELVAAVIAAKRRDSGRAT